MKSEVITVGTEILMGQIANTNAAFISQELLKLGVGVYYQTAVGDNPQRLEEVFSNALQRTDLVVLTGGLGPTQDDLTRETVARVMGAPLVKDEDWEKKLEEFFKERARSMTENNRKQALVPEGGIILTNKRGTAPGVFLEKDNRIVVMLPGPPHEMQQLYREELQPLLAEKIQISGEEGIICSRILRLIGVGESAMETMIEPLVSSQSNPTIAPLAKRTEVHLRISARAGTAEEAEKMIVQKKKEIEELLGDYIYGEDEETLEYVVAKLLWRQNKSLALGESCTGGLLCHRLTNVSGSSEYLVEGMVAYSNKAKIDYLHVDSEVLKEKGAVSAEVAAQMAAGARDHGGSDLGIGITGIAGPGGGTADKPVGLTYIALNTRELSYCKRYQLWGNREEIKERASQAALNLVRLYLLGKIENHSSV